MNASISSINGDRDSGIFLPKWFLAVVAGAFISVSFTVISVGIGTWSTTNHNTDTIKEQGQRLDNLERLYTDVATVRANLDTTNQDTRYIRDKLDQLQTMLLEEKRDRK